VDETETETIDRLAADYCQLLIGPKKHLPPVQSVWADHTFQSKAASSMGRYFELYADYLPPGTIHDHLGCQLDFVAFLLDEASRGEDHSQSAMQVLKQFQQEHLQWAQQLIDRVAQKADTDFYRGLAVVTDKLIKELSR
jgi:TorA maturation chaperone TorD